MLRPDISKGKCMYGVKRKSECSGLTGKSGRNVAWMRSRVQFSSVTQSCPVLCDPMDCSTPGFPVLHQLPELAQTHVHQVGDAIQPSYPLSSPSAVYLSPHQGLF